MFLLYNLRRSHTFLVDRTEIFLLQASKVEGFSAKGMHRFLLPLDANNYKYFGFLLAHERFNFIGCTVSLRQSKIFPAMQFVMN